MKVLLILLLLVPTLAMSKVYKKDGKFFIKTSKSGFKYHKNFMDHHDHNFKYIKDKKKHVLESTISNLSLETAIVLEMMMVVGPTVTPTEKELSFQQGHGNLLRKINVI